MIQNSYLRSSSIIKIYLTLPVLIRFAIVLPMLLNCIGVRSGVVVKTLRYKPAGRGFDSQQKWRLLFGM
jgi:hypothetical protein